MAILRNKSIPRGITSINLEGQGKEGVMTLQSAIRTVGTSIRHIRASSLLGWGALVAFLVVPCLVLAQGAATQAMSVEYRECYLVHRSATLAFGRVCVGRSLVCLGL